MDDDILSPPNDLHEQPGCDQFQPRTVRHLLYHAKTNGLAKSGAIIKIGRKVLIDVRRFLVWVNQHRIQQ